MGIPKQYFKWMILSFVLILIVFSGLMFTTIGEEDYDTVITAEDPAPKPVDYAGSNATAAVDDLAETIMAMIPLLAGLALIPMLILPLIRVFKGELV